MNGLGTKNYYKIIPKKYLPESFNYPNKSKIHMNLPARIGIIGASGSCKTNWLLNFIGLVDRWDTITIYAKTLSEPLYQYLLDCLKQTNIIVKAYDTIDEVHPCSDYSPKKNNLIVIDDFISANPKQLRPISDIFIMGRKWGISCCFISQSYYKIPQIIRQNLSHIVIFKISTKNDLNRVIDDNSLDLDIHKALKLLKYIRNLGPTNFMLIDKNSDENDLKYRINFARTPVDLE
jgi:hypothetical protein